MPLHLTAGKAALKYALCLCHPVRTWVSNLKGVDMTFEQFKTNVERWQAERGIYEHSTALAQALKGVSEAGELADAVIKGDRDALKDSVGDTLICLVGVAKMLDINMQCAEDILIDHSISIQESAVVAAMIAYFVSDIASDVSQEAEAWSIEDSLESALIYLGIIAKENGFTLMECCESAWNEIKDRKGKMVAGGAFVKEVDA